jgi:hypothetical protein
LELFSTEIEDQRAWLSSMLVRRMAVAVKRILPGL